MSVDEAKLIAGLEEIRDHSAIEGFAQMADDFLKRVQDGDFREGALIMLDQAVSREVATRQLTNELHNVAVKYASALTDREIGDSLLELEAAHWGGQ